MRMQSRQELRLQQKLSPQLILNLQLLSLSIQELEQVIEKELENNPALERIEESSEPELTAGSILINSEDREFEAEAKTGSLEAIGDVREEVEIADLFPQDGWELPVEVDRGEEESITSEVFVQPAVTYRETLLPRLLAEVKPEDAKLADEILGWLDEDGLLTVPVDELAVKLGVDLSRLERVLTALKRIPPGGVGARDVREVLLVQLTLRGFSPDSLEVRMINESWELLRFFEVPKLARLFNRGEDDVLSAIANIGHLEPRPGRQFNSPAPEYIIPDFAVEWREGRLEIKEIDTYIPRLIVARRFIEIIQNSHLYSRDTVAFARQKVQNAVMFLKAIESRRRLLRRLVELVVERQKDFFVRGPGYLKPLTVKEAGSELGVSVSTVSRAINGKFIETPRGIFKLRDFFRVGSGGLSRTGIKERVREIIEQEDKDNPLSDDEICLRLGKEGVRVSRRTVAKYRAELGIPGSDLRRRF